MECNMIKNGLRMVRGNAFSLRIKVRAYRIDGTEIGDFVLNPLTDTLLLTSSSTVRPLAFSVEDGSTNNAVVSFGAAMQAGYYGLDFSGVWDGVAWRFSAKNVFQIVELTAQGNVPKDGVIYDDTYDTHAEVTLTSQSVQSDWAQNDPTNPSYIRNKPEIYTKAEINVLLDNIYTKSEVDGLISDEEERAKAAEKANADDIDGIEEKIPSGASSQNKLVDEQTMNSSIATATATYRGAYNLVSDLELTTAATEQQIAAALATKMTALGITPDNNDYCYVQVPTSDATPTEIARVDRYKYNGAAWGFEYSLNNSGFTAAQWAALNSGITSGLVAKLVDLPTNSELTTLLGGKEDKSNKVTSLSAESTDTQYPSAKCVYELHKQNADDIDGIEEKIPSGASSQNKLVDQQTMNSSIATATATYRGAYNLVSDLELTTAATEQQIAAALATKMTALSITPDNNDYCFVQVPTSDATPTQIARVDRYKYNGTAWTFEFSLNNSGFTAAQWAALNSGITSELVTKLSDLPTYTELMTLFGGKQDTINDLSDIRSGAAKGETAYQKPVGGIPSEDMSSGVQSSLQKAENAAPQSTTYNKTEVDGMIGGIEEKIPSGASSQNKLVDQQTMNSSIATATATYRGAYNLVSDLSLTVSATEQQIAAALATVMASATPPIVPDNNDYCFVQVPTSDATPTQIARVDRYKYNGTAWTFEFSLNNSGFTAAQWAALNSGITSGLVAKLSDLPTNSELTTLLAGKQDTINDLSDIRSGAAKGETAYQKPVGGIPSEDMSSGVQSSLQKAENAAPQSTTYNKTEVDGMIGGIEEKIPSGASSQNKLVDQQTMNSSIATATATYRGAYNLVSDLSLTVSATEQQIAAALATKMAALSITPDNNDYCFVQVPTADATPTQIARVDRYKFNGTAWAFEFSLNNSGFTAAQWAALNSGITSGLVTKLSDLPTYTELMTLLGGKQNTLTFDNAPTENSDNPVKSGGVKAADDNLQNQITLLQNIVADLETIAEGYVRVAGAENPALNYRSYKYHEQGGFGRESVFHLFYPCLVGTKLSGNDAQVGKILHVLKKFGAVTVDNTPMWEDLDGNHHAIDGSEGDVLICNIEPYYQIYGQHDILGTTYDVFLMARTPFTWQGIDAEPVAKFGISPDYVVSHQDTDDVVRMHSVYNPSWNGNYDAPVGVVGKYIYTTDPDTGDIVETYDSSETLLGGAGGLHSTDIDLPTGEQRAMNNNPDTTKTVPWMNQTAHVCELMQCLLLAEGGTFDAHKASLMGSGFSTNDGATDAADWEAAGSGAKNGMRYVDKNGNLQYRNFGWMEGNTAWAFMLNITSVANMINSWRSPWHVMEALRAVSHAIQNDVHELEWFTFEGNKYKYRSVDGFNGPAQGEMTCVVWKMMSTKFTSAAKDPSDGTTSLEGKRADFLVSTALLHGVTTQVSPSWWVSGLVFTEDAGQNYEAYMERDQEQLAITPTGDKTTDDAWPFESNYQHVGSFTVGEGYRKNYSNQALMIPNNNTNKTGGGLHTYVGAYNWFTGGAAPSGKKSVRGWLRGYVADNTVLSPLALDAGYSPSAASSGVGFGTCCRITE